MQIAKCRYRSTGHQLKGANPQIVICPSNSVCITVSTFCYISISNKTSMASSSILIVQDIHAFILILYTTFHIFISSQS